MIRFFAANLHTKSAANYSGRLHQHHCDFPKSKRRLFFQMNKTGETKSSTWKLSFRSGGWLGVDEKASWAEDPDWLSCSWRVPTEKKNALRHETMDRVRGGLSLVLAATHSPVLGDSTALSNMQCTDDDRSIPGGRHEELAWSSLSLFLFVPDLVEVIVTPWRALRCLLVPAWPSPRSEAPWQRR